MPSTPTGVHRPPTPVRPPTLDPTLDVTHLAAAGLALGQTWSGLSSREAERRGTVFGPNTLPAPPASRWWRDVLTQLTHPLALLLWVAAALAWWSGTPSLTVAIVLVIFLNAAFAFVQERQAERSVDAISAYIPQSAMVRRDGQVTRLASELLVPGDLVTVVEGDRVCADARIVSGTADLDLSMLTGESVPVERGVEMHPHAAPLLQARHVVLSGTSVVAGEIQAVVYATGTHTQIGQIASLTRSVRPDPSPLERQVRRVAWILAAVAVGVGAAFVPLGLVAGLTWQASLVFAIGLLVANVPEGLLPTITLALATGVRRLARHGAVVKRLSAVETLGSTSTICTDKTGTLTKNEMHVREVVAPDGGTAAPVLAAATRIMGSCHQVRQQDGTLAGDPTEVALVEEAIRTGGALDLEAVAAQVVATFRFDPVLRRMTVVLPQGSRLQARCKGAVESLVGLCRTQLTESGERPLAAAGRTQVLAVADTMARRGLRVLALADRDLGRDLDRPAPTDRDVVEQHLRLVALVGLIDPPRPDVATAVAQCHLAGIRVHVVTGDHPATATAIAREVGVRPTVTIDGSELDTLDDAALDALMASGSEVVFARSSPQAKLRIAEAARAVGQVVAMTGDGVNNAPALRAADIGVAMGRGGTDVAREAASMVLSDDNFATIVTAVESGRRVYANIRKFILYIFAHAVPEVVPFLLFALSGGSIPLGLTVMQILAIDLGTETLPALALGSERAEPGLMEQPPRPQHEQIIRGGLLWRAWGVLGLTSAVLSTGAFLLVLRAAGWSPGDPVSAGSDLHHAYLQATSVTFLAIVLCQVGTAFAARTDHASLRTIGPWTNRALLWGVAFELLVAAAVVYTPFLQPLFHTAAPHLTSVLPLLVFPFVVWGVDELLAGVAAPADAGPSTPVAGSTEREGRVMTRTTLPAAMHADHRTPQVRPNSAYVVPFESGSMKQSDLLGGKGANLAEMTRLGLPVPPGFIITTTVCRQYMTDGAVPVELMPAVRHELGYVERTAGQGFGDPQDPLLISVRSGARFSMPGMMETILDVGLNDETVVGLGRRSGEKFAWDCYARLVSMYGRTVMEADHDKLAAITTEVVERYGVAHESLLDPDGLRDLVQALRAELMRSCGYDLPQDPYVQLENSITAVLRSWNSDRARLYRHEERIPDDLGTAVSVMAMVFGNAGTQSGSGVCFTRDPASGDPGPMGNYLPYAQGEDVVNGSRDAHSLDYLAQHLPELHAQLLHHLETLERHYRDLCDVEFTVEEGRLWILQTRVGKRTPGAAFRIARDLVAERHISWDEALVRVSGAQLDTLLNPTFVDDAMRRPLCSGHPVSPGAAVGQIALDSATAARWAAEGRPVILVREETSPDDLEGLLAAHGVVTSRGGVTSHAAVVARGMGKPCVVGTGMVIDAVQRLVEGDDGVTLAEGDVISLDGTTGQVSVGAIAVRPSAVAAAVAGEHEQDPSPTDLAVSKAVTDLLAHADSRRRLKVYANADNGPDAARARRLGAQGVGLCRTEHQLLGERRAIVEDIVLDRERAAALRAFSAVQREDMREVMLAMDGQDVVIRLLDPPLHEFLPDLVETAMQVARDEATGTVVPQRTTLLAALRRWSERNPMLGLRGVRLALVFPEILEAQVEALAEAFLDLQEHGHDPRPHLMVPLVSDVAEVLAARETIDRCLEQPAQRRGLPVPSIPLGTMIELPRAALTAGALAAECSFFSFGTNDLTQTTWGMSRDDAETAFLPAYYSAGLLAEDPFATIDPAGVGRLMTIAIAEGRATRPQLGLGVCGEQGGDPASVQWFHEAGLDYVSCSPPRLCSARLEAGRAAVRADVTGSDSR